MINQPTAEIAFKQMASGEDDPTTPQFNLLELLIAQVRERYREEHGEDPPESFMEEARRKAILELARELRNQNREIYDALADE